jgi:hypothetical protein
VFRRGGQRHQFSLGEPGALDIVDDRLELPVELRDRCGPVVVMVGGDDSGAPGPGGRAGPA